MSTKCAVCSTQTPAGAVGWHEEPYVAKDRRDKRLYLSIATCPKCTEFVKSQGEPHDFLKRFLPPELTVD
ncbi:MAG: hypothetical protein Q8N26_32015 [Myxococcales bacterium]|nr:hypothetical protein [Myxococcales bacterium]